MSTLNPRQREAIRTRNRNLRYLRELASEEHLVLDRAATEALFADLVRDRNADFGILRERVSPAQDELVGVVAARETFVRIQCLSTSKLAVFFMIYPKVERLPFMVAIPGFTILQVGLYIE